MNCFFTEPLYFLICDNVEVHKIVLKRPSIILVQTMVKRESFPKT